MTNRPGPFVTIRAGGPLEGLVTVTAVADSGRRCLIEASWSEDGERFSESLEVVDSATASPIAQADANQFTLGNRPDLTSE